MSKRKVTAAGLVIVMALSFFAGCGAQKENGNTNGTSTTVSADTAQTGTESKLEQVELKIMIPGDRPANMEAVQAEAEKRMADTINVKLNIVFIPWADLPDKTQVTLSSGGDIDLLFDAPWLHITQMIFSGYYQQLDELLKQYGQNLLKNRPQQMWDANKFDGKIMGMPLGNSAKGGIQYYIRKDIREKLGIAPIKTYEDLIDFAYAVKDKLKGVSPLLAAGDASGKDLSWAVFRKFFDYDTHIDKTHALGLSLMLYYKNNDGEVYNMLETNEPTMLNWFKEARKLYLDKVIDQDVLSYKNVYDPVVAGKVAAVAESDFGVPTSTQEQIAKTIPGAEFEAVSFYDPTPGKNISDFKQWNFICLAAVSKNKERAIQFLDWTNANQDNYDLLAYGIKGVDWEPVGDDQYKSLGDKYLWFPYAWIWNPVMDRINAGFDENSIKLIKFNKEADNFTKDILTGFDFNPKPVTNEIAQYQAIEDKYYTALSDGVIDPEQTLVKLKTEGGEYLKKIQVELQKQIDAFLAK